MRKCEFNSSRKQITYRIPDLRIAPAEKVAWLGVRCKDAGLGHNIGKVLVGREPLVVIKQQDSLVKCIKVKMCQW